jgi:hypothetical protein
MKSLVARLFGAGSRLSDLERLVLNAVRSRLGPELVQAWDRQVQAINKVQRLPDAVEVDFYRMSKGRATFDAGLAFHNKTPELHLATVRVSWSNGSSELVARVWCVRGFLFSIEYSGSVAYFDEAAGMDPPPDFMIACELHADLSRAVSVPPA